PWARGKPTSWWRRASAPTAASRPIRRSEVPLDSAWVREYDSGLRIEAGRDHASSEEVQARPQSGDLEDADGTEPQSGRRRKERHAQAEGPAGRRVLRLLSALPGRAFLQEGGRRALSRPRLGAPRPQPRAAPVLDPQRTSNPRL